MGRPVWAVTEWPVPSGGALHSGCYVRPELTLAVERPVAHSAGHACFAIDDTLSEVCALEPAFRDTRNRVV